MWFTETPWPPIIILGGIGFVLVLLAGSKQTVKLWIAALICGLGCLLIWVIERNIVTEAERIEQHILDLSAAFQRNETEQFVGYVSAQSAVLRALFASAIALVDIDEGYRITDMQVTVRANETLAESRFRANATGRLGTSGASNHYPTYWLLRWRKEAGEWKITELQRLNPVGGAPIGVFE